MISLGILVQQLVENPALLGLGDLYLTRVSSQPDHAGLLLEDPVGAILYIVELQPATDDRQVIRLAERWAVVRKRHPRDRCVPVLVAAEIPPRYVNILQVISASVPIVATEWRAAGGIATVKALRLR